MKNVVATDEFGDIAEGNVAEFLKFMPGVNIDYAGGNARDISLNGVPATNVPVTLDGFGLASAVGEERAVPPAESPSIKFPSITSRGSRSHFRRHQTRRAARSPVPST